MGNINSQCLDNNTVYQTDAAITLTIGKLCQLLTVTGQPTALNTAMSKQCSGLALDDAFSGGTMSNLTGWINTPITLADYLNNMWLTICDLRVGTKQAIEQSQITCADIKIDFLPIITYNASQLLLSFSGYSDLKGFIDDVDSEIKIVDTAGNEYITSFTFTDALTSQYITIDLSASGLLSSSDYTITVTANIKNTVTSCQKIVTKTVENPVVTCPVITAWSTTTQVSYSFDPAIKSNITYTMNIYDNFGTTVASPQSVTNPTGVVTNVFTGLQSGKTYTLQITTKINGTNPITCNSINISTA